MMGRSADIMHQGPLTTAKNFIITVSLWAYYILGFLLFFSIFYIHAFFFADSREISFQKLNHRLLGSFFSLVRILVPSVKWQIAQEVKAVRSSIIIANHLSFLDPILFVSLFEKQKTIVKSAYFRFPFFGWILKTSGYVPTAAEELFTPSMADQIKNLKAYLASGGNLFIFPEGTRSRNGLVGAFDKGAFKIARRCRAPISVVIIRNTHKLFPPDRFLFNTCEKFAIEVELAGIIIPDYESDEFSLTGLMEEATAMMEKKSAS